MHQIRQILKQLISSTVPRSLFLVHGAPRHPVSTASRAQKTESRPQVNLAFTFDDGPHPELTPPLLYLLQQQRQQATFFVIGKRARQHPELIKRMVKEGHEIGNHTLTHSEPSKTSTRQFLDEIEQTDQILNNLTGCVPRLVRPPKGKLTAGKMLGLWKQRKTIVLWDTDPRDYQMTDSTQIVNWCQNYQPVNGNFCLMHDNHPYALEAVRLLSQNQETSIRSLGVSHWLRTPAKHTKIDERAYA